jgi:hypothetical protein
MLLTGAMIFAGTYATTAAITAGKVDNANGDRTLYLPVVGPWLHLADIDEGTANTIWIAGSGILQGLGLAISAVSFFVPEKIPAATIEAAGVKVNVTATSFGKGSAGIGASGQF